ncbi:putative phosphoribosyl 1,2-cyclic phosphate 1,2-diphosphodiesterase [Helianthus annuus]|nr:putative phosphoribosyl 1,2-cyclic phosphate 1,2-diphosphodiesterase [Helianthus annuus]KAJ0508908.1 putative phosphoribosyl 1,2-cyclic phosphate 1,2-diphosphodiesterase [Helianthus annuus]KAJ0517079.1 putative phosphoribosyl 1,2-cyclic phosphate 1,2-diphosphodiesterase [Helianthus annuus]KAJ0685088.1 putative phosphoribosyl 1,2-cyclic phosphate 1,2-diphosphodiesterase [Helianthus annuus]KAJ0689005.1 putative phosphoribosyl 1,2-cyclic phosphate 1,2-diphosphodiesterase [Helianthus annuus]
MGSNSCNHNKHSKKKNNKRSATKKRMTLEQSLAYKSVTEWVFLDTLSCSPNSTIAIDDDFKVKLLHTKVPADKLVFELHSHSICSDGFLSPSKLVERAHQFGVKVLSLTDHDTMAGIPQALEAARKVGIKIIPGVEISTIFNPRTDTGSEEPVHVLAYYSSCGPSNYEKLDQFLANIREGRYLRAENMISKLNKLKLPIRWENVEKIAGDGVAPGRLHVARAMVEAGHVENLKQAFSRYLYDGGPAYSTGSEPDAEEAVRLVCETGGVAVLAHPWALKNPVAIIRRLKEAGLHGLEVYRSDGKLAAFSDLADTYDLLKLGGSDYHARGGSSESALGSVSLPMVAVHEFLKVARPIWCGAIKKTVDRYITEPTESNLEHILRYAKIKVVKGGGVSSITTRNVEIIHECLSQWLTNEEQKSCDFEAVTLAEDKP